MQFCDRTKLIFEEVFLDSCNFAKQNFDPIVGMEMEFIYPHLQTAAGKRRASYWMGWSTVVSFPGVKVARAQIRRITFI
jgi:hypothetical protein